MKKMSLDLYKLFDGALKAEPICPQAGEGYTLFWIIRVSFASLPGAPTRESPRELPLI